MDFEFPMLAPSNAKYFNHCCDNLKRKELSR